MNPYKKIDRLEQRIRQLEQENQALLLECRENRTYQKEQEQNHRLAVRYKTEYDRLLHELKQEQTEVRQLIHRLKYEADKSAGTYRHALRDIKENMQICRLHT